MLPEELRKRFRNYKSGLAEAESMIGDKVPVKVDQGESFCDQFDLDVRLFCSYLAATDGRLSQQEVDFMNTIMDKNYSHGTYMFLLQEEGWGTPEKREQYEKGSISSFKIAICLDFLFEKMGRKTSFVDTVIDLFLEAGMSLCYADGITEQEEEDIRSFIMTKNQEARNTISVLNGHQ